MTRCLDLFCGAGGSSLGAAAAGAEIVAGIDADAVACSTSRGLGRAAEWRPWRTRPAPARRALDRLDPPAPIDERRTQTARRQIQRALKALHSRMADMEQAC